MTKKYNINGRTCLLVGMFCFMAGLGTCSLTNKIMTDERIINIDLPRSGKVEDIDWKTTKMRVNGEDNTDYSYSAASIRDNSALIWMKRKY